MIEYSGFLDYIDGGNNEADSESSPLKTVV